MDEVTLYPGDNGAQEFYEAPDGSWLVCRSRGSSTWTVYRDGSGLTDQDRLLSDGPGHHTLDTTSLDQALKKVLRQYGVQLLVDESQHFVSRGGVSMELSETAVPA